MNTQHVPTNARLSSKAVIATISIGCWRVERVHAEETAQVNAKHGTQKAATVRVDLLKDTPLGPILRAIREEQTAARATHYRLTLPGADKGIRLLPGRFQLEHADAMNAARSRIDALVARFIAEYPQVAADAPATLGALYIAGQWPSADEVKARFYLRDRYLPVPDVGQWADWLAEAAAAAEEDLRERFSAAITHIADTLADPKKRVWESLTGNLSNLLARAHDLNLNDDPGIAALTEQAKDLLVHDRETLRDDPVARSETAARAAELVSLFNLS